MLNRFLFSPKALMENANALVFKNPRSFIVAGCAAAGLVSALTVTHTTRPYPEASLPIPATVRLSEPPFVLVVRLGPRFLYSTN